MHVKFDLQCPMQAAAKAYGGGNTPSKVLASIVLVTFIPHAIHCCLAYSFFIDTWVPEFRVNAKRSCEEY